MQDVVPGKIILCDDPSQAAQGDAVICVTQSKDEFLKEEWLSRTPSSSPWAPIRSGEDAVLLHADKIVVDHVEQTMHRGPVQAGEPGQAEREQHHLHHRPAGRRKSPAGA